MLLVTTGIVDKDGCERSHDHDQKEHNCGHLLGLDLNTTTDDLYVDNAYMCLLLMGPNDCKLTHDFFFIQLNYQIDSP